MAVEEFAAGGIDDARAFATQRFGNQKCAAGMKQSGGMELHVLQIDRAGAGAMRERQSIAARAGRICGVQIEPADAAGRKHGLLRAQRHDAVALD
jgi:hypothetical protein